MKKPTEARVVQYDTYGNADVLKINTLPLAAPAAGQVTVEVICAGISHIDVFIRNGKEKDAAETDWPRGSGSDFTGIVVAVGAGVTRFSVGAEVIGYVACGAHASHLNVDARALVPKPKAVTWEAAGGMYLAGATALDTLDDLKIGPGDIVVISAAAGGVGSIEAQLAKHLGATVIGTCGDRNFDYLRQLGIKPVRYGEGIADRIRKAAGGQVTAMIDNFGQDGHELADELGVSRSRYRSSADRRDTELRLLRDDPEALAHAAKQLGRLAQFAQARAFTLLISGLYSLDDIAGAYEDLEKLHSRGKVLLGTKLVNTYRIVKARDLHEAAL